MTDYVVRNLHSVPRSYPSDQNGQMISFAPGEQKTVKTSPPDAQSMWEYEVVEETVKPEDTELKQEEEDDGSENVEGGDN